MIKKRVLYALLWSEGYFCQSRNFRLQKVGDLPWLIDAYDFESVASSVDEIIVLDVSRRHRQSSAFHLVVEHFAAAFQLPLAAGGGVRSSDSLDQLLRKGADKVILNSILYRDRAEVHRMSSRFGRQALIASIDFRRGPSAWNAYSGYGEGLALAEFRQLPSEVIAPVGEIILQSIDQDGTGNGLDIGILDALPETVESQVILMGGAGKPRHIASALSDARVDGVATANLLNFMGRTLASTREECRLAGVPLATRNPWPMEGYDYQ